MGRQGEFWFNAKRSKAWQKNLKSKAKTGGGLSSKLIRHQLEKKKIGIPCCNLSLLYPVNPVSRFPPGWVQTNRRGKPGKSVVLFEAPAEKPVNESLMRPTNKRNLQLVSLQYHCDNPNTSSSKKLTIPTAGNNRAEAPANFPDKKKEAMSVDRGRKSAESGGGSTPKQPLICRNCRKELDSRSASGGHPAIPVMEDTNFSRSCSSEVRYYREEEKKTPGRRGKEVVQHRAYCPWCERSFANTHALAAHCRFCQKKKEQVRMGGGEGKPVAVGRNFDLNHLPPEAYPPEETLMLTWH